MLRSWHVPAVNGCIGLEHERPQIMDAFVHVDHHEPAWEVPNISDDEAEISNPKPVTFGESGNVHTNDH
jgi:hypothetical protein